jgi:alpha-beta hydrolase superfamily lysophospholipase
VYPRAVSRPDEIRFRAGDLMLAGELLLPDAPPPDDRRGRYPWVLLIGSWLARDRDGAFDAARHPSWYGADLAAQRQAGLLLRLADSLAEQGVATFRFDPRGCGASDGDWAATDLFTRIDDARDALGAMRSRRELDLSRTGILGHGEGAAIALSVAIPDPVIGALTLIGAPARSLRDVLRRGAAMRTRSGEDLQHPLVAAIDYWSEEIIERAERREAAYQVPLAGGESVRLNLAAWEQAFHTPAIALVSMLHRSVSLFHGTADASSHPDESRLLADALRRTGNQPTLTLLEGAGHDLRETTDAEVSRIAADLARRLLPRDLPPVLVALEELG